jgi:hypothetical protein
MMTEVSPTFGGGSTDPASIFQSSANEVGAIVIDIESFALFLLPKLLASFSRHQHVSKDLSARSGEALQH